MLQNSHLGIMSAWYVHTLSPHGALCHRPPAGFAVLTASTMPTAGASH